MGNAKCLVVTTDVPERQQTYCEYQVMESLPVRPGSVTEVVLTTINWNELSDKIWKFRKLKGNKIRLHVDESAADEYLWKKQKEAFEMMLAAHADCEVLTNKTLNALQKLLDDKTEVAVNCDGEFYTGDEFLRRVIFSVRNGQHADFIVKQMFDCQF